MKDKQKEADLFIIALVLSAMVIGSRMPGWEFLIYVSIIPMLIIIVGVLGDMLQS